MPYSHREEGKWGQVARWQVVHVCRGALGRSGGHDSEQQDDAAVRGCMGRRHRAAPIMQGPKGYNSAWVKHVRRNLASRDTHPTRDDMVWSHPVGRTDGQ